MTLVPTTEATVELASAAQDARSYLEASRSANTARSYRAGWHDFAAWCERHGVDALPAAPETVATYIAERARTWKPSTIDSRLAAIAAAHRAAGETSPTGAEAVRLVRRGIRRTLGTAQRQAHAVVTSELRRLVATCDESLIGRRDAALLLLGFAGALRRSELVALDVDDVEERSEGLVLHLTRSKTDQEGAGREVGVPYGSDPSTCPVRAYRAWREAAGEVLADGPAFRPVDRWGRLGAERLSDRAVSLVVKRRGESAGLDAAELSGHSLRAGLATSAAAAGASERAIMAQTGHKSLPVVRRYIRSGSLFTENAAAAAGL